MPVISNYWHGALMTGSAWNRLWLWHDNVDTTCIWSCY